MPHPLSQNQDRKKNVDNSQLPSSPGDCSVVQTPKDVTPGHAAARDVTERPVDSDDPGEKQEALLDDAIDLTFPASDPIAAPSITKVVPKTDEEADKESSEKESSPQSPLH